MYEADFVLFWGNQKEKENCQFIKDNIIKKNAYLIPDSLLDILGAIINRCDMVIEMIRALHIADMDGCSTLAFTVRQILRQALARIRIYQCEMIS
ncbi:MAG: hypothetical protein R3A12_15390 [Ignavibacteria bacterium]